MPTDSEVPKLPCVKCIAERKVENISDLKPGDHIIMAGKNSRCNCFGRLFSTYQHHSIVAEIISESSDRKSGEIRIIGFEDCDHQCACNCKSGVKLREKKKKIHVNFDKVRKIIYNDKTQTATDRLNYARKLNKNKWKNRYNMIFFNCEHFCHTVCAGRKRSRQVERLFRWTCILPRMVLTSFSIFIRIVEVLFLSTETLISSKTVDTLSISLVVILAYILFYILRCSGIRIRPNFPYLHKLDAAEVCNKCRKLDIIMSVYKTIVIISFQIFQKKINDNITTIDKTYELAVPIVVSAVCLTVCELSVPWISQKVVRRNIKEQ